MQQLFIINPAAGKTDASVVLVPQIQAAAARAGVDVQIEVTRSRGHARQLAEAAAASGEEVHIYAAGGDGTMNEVLQGAANHPNIAVGCIPCGSGNDYVRNFGAPADFLDMDAQLAAEAFPVDLRRRHRRPGGQRYPQVPAHPAVRRDHRVHPVYPRSRLQQLQASSAYSG